MIDGKIVKVEAGEFDKYGRLLTVITAKTTDGEYVNIGDYLVAHKMAKFYDGGTKDAFEQADYDDFLNTYENATWPSFVDYPYKKNL